MKVRGMQHFNNLLNVSGLIFKLKKYFLIISILHLFHFSYVQPQSFVSFTFDDPDTKESPVLSWQERNGAILESLEKNKLKATLFVCGHRVSDENGKELISSWDKSNHQIANHSFNHKYYHSEKFSFQDFKNDFLKNDSLISVYSNYAKFFRFPFLKEGNTLEKKTNARLLLKEQNYRQGYVSIDASDWYVNQLLADELSKNPDADKEVYKQLYIIHILDRANFYDSLATSITGRKVKHILLLHHNLTSALFLDDLIQAFKNNNWTTVSSYQAWQDPIYSEFPNILPAGESIVWALAKESGKYENILRYPGEDSEYEEVKFREFINARR